MININNDFKTIMRQPIKQLSARIIYAEGEMTSEDNLIDFKLTTTSELLKTAMRKLDLKYLGGVDLLSKEVDVILTVTAEVEGVTKTASCNYGLFKITEITYDKEKETTSVIGYDKMINSMKAYTPLDIIYPITIHDYITALSTRIGLVWDTTTLINGDKEIAQELWENIDGITYRDILTQLAQVTASTCIIHDNKLLFKYSTDTTDVLTYENLKSFKVEEMYGVVNSVVLSRTPQEDNIYQNDEVSIIANGLTEIKIENNEIMDKDREEFLPALFTKLNGYSYYPVNVNTEGLGYYEVGDIINITDDNNTTYNTTIFNSTITINGGIKENLTAVAVNKTQTQYQYASTINKRIKNTEIIVNKQEGYIENLVTDVYHEDGYIKENFTKVYQDIDNIINNVQTTSGDNIIQNSVLFAWNDADNTPLSWSISETGTIERASSVEAQNNGSISGQIFTLQNETLQQQIPVVVNDETEYTFSALVYKSVFGTGYIKIYNDLEEYIVNINLNEAYTFDFIEIKNLKPKQNYYIVEIYGSAEGCTFTDVMLNIGAYKSSWTQANGEINNTQVNININGVLVKSSRYEGDYTIMSPLEFAGYSNVNGTLTKIFSLNKDTTNVTKLDADKEIYMSPIKIVPLRSDTRSGWAFVKSIKEDN